MSSVSSSTETQTNYAKTLNELQEEIKEDAKRAESKRQERMKQLEQDYENARVEFSKKAIEATESNRNMAEEAHKKAAARYTKEREELNREYYDRFGKMASKEYEQQKALHDSMQAGFDSEIGARDRRADEQREYYQKLNRDIAQEGADAAAAAVESARKSNEESLGQQLRSERAAYKQLQEKMAADLERTRKDGSLPVSMDRETLQRESAAMAEQQKNKLAAMEKYVVERTQAAHDNLSARYEDGAIRTRESTRQQLADLNNQMNTLLQDKRMATKDRNSAYADARKELESDLRLEQRRMEKASEEKIAHAIRQRDETERSLKEKSSAERNNQEEKYIEAARKAAAEAHDELEYVKESLTKNLEDTEKKAQETQKGLEAAQEERLKEHAKKAEEDIKKVTASTRQVIEDTNKRSQATEAQLHKEIQHLKSTADTTQVSPMVVAKLEKVNKEAFQLSLNEESERNRRETGAAIEKYKANERALIEDSKARENTLMRTARIEEEKTRDFLKNQLEEAAHQKDRVMTESQEQNQKLFDRLNDEHNRTLRNLQLAQDEQVNVSRAEAQKKLQDLRTEKDFEIKMLQRSFAIKQNEMIRGYEKQMLDQKRQLEDVIAEIKFQSDKNLRDTERRGRQEMEAQAKQFEQRIAEERAQNEERSRATAIAHEEQLDKIKRSQELARRKSNMA